MEGDPASGSIAFRFGQYRVSIVGSCHSHCGERILRGSGDGGSLGEQEQDSPSGGTGE